jgi:hypothetical protein
VKEPEPFDDNPSSFKGWIFSVDNYFTFCGRRFPKEELKCLFILNLLTKGESGRWSILQQDIWRRNSSCPFSSWLELRDELQEHFGKSFEEERARIEVSKIRQGKQESPLSFNRRFRSVVQLLGWSLDTEEMLVLYKQAIHPEWLSAIFSALPLDAPKKVTEWMTASERLFHNKMECQLNLEGYGLNRPALTQGQSPGVQSSSSQRPPSRPLPHPSSSFHPRDSGVRFYPLQRPQDENPRAPVQPNLPCYSCGKKGHWAKDCPEKGKSRARVRMLAEEEVVVMSDAELDSWYQRILEQRASDRDLQDIPGPSDAELVEEGRLDF